MIENATIFLCFLKPIQLKNQSLLSHVFQPEPVSEVVLIASRESTLACTILAYYTLHVARHKDVTALLRILPVLARCDADMVYQGTFLHMLTSHMATIPDMFSNPEYARIIFEEFFMVSCFLFFRNWLQKYCCKW